MGFEKIYLFNGKNLEGWKTRGGEPATWPVDNDGVVTVGHEDIISPETYKDAHIHVEFWLPNMPEATGQGKANSGVYVHGCYEVQVLDSYGIADPKNNDCSGIYEQYAPLTNANKPAEEWQTYDIYFVAPKFNDDGEVVEDARMTVIFNGICVHNNIVLKSCTPGSITGKRVAEGPLLLQDHGNRVRFRNVYIEKLN